jgi:hypothetical protein
MLHHLECPIGLQLPTRPVTAEDGRIYDEGAIQKYLAGCRGKRGTVVSPTTNEPMGRRLLPAPHIRQLIEETVKGGVLPPDVAADWLERVKAEKAAALGATEKAALAGDADACAQLMNAASANRTKQSWAYRGMLGTGPGAAECSEFFGAFGPSLYFGELNKMTLLALFASADPHGDNCANSQAALAFIFSNEWTTALRFAKMARGLTPETRGRPPSRSRIKEVALYRMCNNIVSAYDMSPEHEKATNVELMAGMYSFMRLWNVIEANKTLGLPPKTEDVPWHQSVTQEQAVAALDRWRKLMERMLRDTEAFPFLNGQRIKSDYIYDVAWRVFVHEGGIRQALPPGSLDVIGRTAWPGLGIGDPTALTDDQLRAIAVSDFPSLPLKKCPPPSDDRALAEYLKAFRRYTEVGLMRTTKEGLVLPHGWKMVTFGPAGQPVGVSESSAAGAAVGSAADS